MTDVTKVTEVVREIDKNDFSSNFYEDALIRFIAALKSESIEAPFVKAKLNKNQYDLSILFAVFQEEIDKVMNNDNVIA